MRLQLSFIKIRRMTQQLVEYSYPILLQRGRRQQGGSSDDVLYKFCERQDTVKHCAYVRLKAECNMIVVST